jgi:hypothetical protein
VDAQVVYTDVSPDYVGGFGTQFFLDLNDDGINDFNIYNSNSNLYIAPVNSSNEVLGSVSYSFAYPYALNFQAPISSGAGSFTNNGYSYGYQSLNYGSGSFGNWVNVTNKYLGLHFQVGAQDYYGWARLDVGTSGNVWTLKDFAYESTPGRTILAGVVLADTALNVTASDLGNAGNGSDLVVAFDSARNEQYVKEYRIMVVKATAAAGFDLAASNGVLPGNYTAVTPTAAPSYSQALAASARDTDGDLITDGVAYEVFVYSEANGTNSTENSLNSVSASVTITNLLPADIALNVTATDIGDNGNGTDLQVDFDAAANENLVGEYRIMVVKNPASGAFDSAVAAAVPLANYTAVNPNGSPTYSTALSASSVDTDGNAIKEDEPYVIFVYSDTVGVSNETAYPSLSSSTAGITLKSFIGINEQSLAAVSMRYYDNKISIGDFSHVGKNAVLNVIDMKGQLVFTRAISGNHTYDISNLSAGTYVMQLAIDKQLRSEKFVK